MAPKVVFLTGRFFDDFLGCQKTGQKAFLEPKKGMGISRGAAAGRAGATGKGREGEI